MCIRDRGATTEKNMEPRQTNGSDRFDARDRDSWYFGKRSREETNEILMKEKASGVFLIRDSQSIKHDYVLSVREQDRVNHYIINNLNPDEKPGIPSGFRIGDRTFASLEELLDFYKVHYLDTEVLSRPASKPRLLVLFDFEGRDASDLPIRKGEVLTLIYRLDDDENWLVAKNDSGRKGEIPTSYVELYDPEKAPQRRPTNSARKHPSPVVTNRKLPARARVIKQRVPSAYDEHSLRLEVGELVTITATNPSGMWEGYKDAANGARITGTLPFNFVQFVDDDQSPGAANGRPAQKNLSTINEFSTTTASVRT